MSRRPFAAPKYQADLIDVFTLPLADGPRVVILKKSAQVGYTSAIMASLAYFLEVERHRVSVYLPNDRAAGAFSKDTIAPVIEANPKLAALVAAIPDQRQASLSLKMLPNGAILRILGAVSPTQFRRYTAEVVLLDELDGYPADIGGEGNPVLLAGRATRNQGGRTIAGSTPTLEGESLIEREEERSDLVFDYAVRCPQCGAFDVLEWDGFTWDAEGDIATRAASVRYAGTCCGGEWRYRALPGALAGGRWQVGADVWIERGALVGADWPRQVAFRLWAGYSVWWPWVEMVSDWLRAQGDPAALKAFTTLALGRSWRDADLHVEESELMQKAEDLAVLPETALVGVLAVDVQDSWLSAMVTAWGPDEESWIIDRREFHGGNDTADAPAWLALFEWIRSGPTWARESGDPLRIDLSVLDTGFSADVCYGAALRWPSRCMPVKGFPGFSRPVLKLPASKVKTRDGRTVPLYNIGVDTGKVTTVGRLARGQIHLADSLPPVVFGELAAERLVTRKQRGRSRKMWTKTQDRNEALDQMVYSLAAIRLRNPVWDSVATRKATAQPATAAISPPAPVPVTPAPKAARDPFLERARRQRRRAR